METVEWFDNVDRFVDDGFSDKFVVAAALTGWLETPVVDYTEGMWEAVCRRTSWVFPDGWVFSVGAGFKPVLTLLEDVVVEQDGFPMPDFFNKNGWCFVPHINGWCWVDADFSVPPAETLTGLLEVFTVVHGVPELALPWYYMFGEYAVGQGEDYYELYSDDFEDDSVNVYYKMFMLSNKLVDVVAGEKAGKVSLPWRLKVDSETVGLSEHSDFMKFLALVEKIRETNLMIVDLDQHCAGCSSGVEKWAAKENPALEGKPVFRTWGQGSEMSWLGDGTVWLEDVWVSVPAVEKKLKFLAEEVGIHTGIYEDDWEPYGGFSLISPHVTVL